MESQHHAALQDLTDLLIKEGQRQTDGGEGGVGLKNPR